MSGNRKNLKKGLRFAICIAFLSVWPCLDSGVSGENLNPEIKSLIGTAYLYPKSVDLIDKYGYPDTLSGTNNSIWVAYFPKGDFTIIADKNTNMIKKVLPGKQPQ
jgi:hypothetical protein